MTTDEINLFDKSLIKELNKKGYTNSTSIQTIIHDRLKESPNDIEKNILIQLLTEIQTVPTAA